MLKQWIRNITKREHCACCDEPLHTLGYVRGYIKSTYFMCKNTNCDAHHHIVHFKNGRLQSRLYARFISKNERMVTYLNLKTKEISSQEYL